MPSDDTSSTGPSEITPADSAATGRAPDRTKSGRKILHGISARAYEHPADKAAMAALRRVPGFDLVLRKLIGFIGERSLRFLYMASAVRVNEGQFPRVCAIYDECLEILDIETRPELYVAQTPIVNAGAVGVDKPFIVLNSGTIELFDDDELRLVIGHELGHIMSDHSLYKTMLGILLRMSLLRVGVPLTALALFGIIVALKEWDRKSELSGDRAGLLCLQDPRKAYQVHMRMAGGSKVDRMSIDEFIKQAEDYEAAGDVVDGVFKIMNLLRQSHPFHVIRLAQLKRWVDAGGYESVLGGDYPRRDADEEGSVYEEVADGAKSYRESYSKSKDPLMKFFQEVSDAGSSVLGKVSDAAGTARGWFSRGSGK